MNDFKAHILSCRIANEKSAAFYVNWVTGFYGYCSASPEDAVTKQEIEKYLGYLSKRKEEWQVRQASDAIQLYLFHKKKKDRETVFPERLKPALQEHLKKVRVIHEGQRALKSTYVDILI